MRPSYYMKGLLEKPNAQYARDYLGITALPGAGDTLGPASSNDKAIARYSGITGKIIQDSTVKVEDDGRISNLTDPSIPQDAATKGYVDDQIASVTGVATVIRVDDPEGSLTAIPGVLCFATGTQTLWLKTSGSGDTGWTQLI